MSYNTGKVLNTDEIGNVEKAFNDFAEGNVYLEKLLLECYNLNIKTRACCAGHEEKQQCPYISFLYIEENKNFIYYLLLKLGELGIEFDYMKVESNSGFSLNFKMYDSKCFKIILDLLPQYDRTRYYYLDLPISAKNYIDIINYIENSNLVVSNSDVDSDYFKFNYKKDNNEYECSMVTTNDECIELAASARFKPIKDTGYTYYSAKSSEEEINKKLEVLKGNIEKKLDTESKVLLIPNDLQNKSFKELDIHFKYQDNNRNTNFVECNLGESVETMAIKLAICRQKGVYAYTIINNIEINNYNSADPNEIYQNYMNQFNSIKDNNESKGIKL